MVADFNTTMADMTADGSYTLTGKQHTGQTMQISTGE